MLWSPKPTDEPMPAFSQPIALPVVLVLMGVSGSGKTTIGQLLAQRLHWL